MGLVMTERPIKNGEEKIYDTYNGNLIAVRHWKKNVEDGVQESYDRQTKTLVHQYTVVSGKKEGAEKVWLADGTLVTDLTWKDGEATGVVMTERGTDRLALMKALGYSITQLKDGQKQGQRKSYDVGGGNEYLSKVENFKDDHLDGLTQKFDNKGNVIWQVRYSQGQLAMDDEATANAIGDCVANWANRYRGSSLNASVRPQDMEQRIAYETPEWERRCKEGHLQ